MIELKNKIYIGIDGRESTYDISLPDSPIAIILFAHGYKGYKDWGAWDLVANYFVKKNYGFIKFNFSHNGGTVEEPIDFPDLDAFGKNDYSKELFDLNKMTLLAERVLKEKDLDIPIYLIGHSRGGGMAIIHGSRDLRINKVVSWAGISDIESRFPVDEDMEDWKELKVRHVLNGRTKQMMPHFYSMFENFEANREILDIKKACENMKKPFLQIHGDMDLAGSISEGIQISRWSETRINIIKGAGHTFQVKHPWKEKELPYDMKNVVEQTHLFLSDQLNEEE